MSMPVPRTAKEIIQAGDLDHCGVRELIDLAAEMGIRSASTYRPAVLRAIKDEARRRGWL